MESGEDYGPRLVIVVSTLLAFSTISVAARCYTQILILKRFYLEDWLAVLTWAIFAAFTAICCVGVHYGLGKPVADVPLPQHKIALMYKLIGMSIYVFVSGLVKFVVGVYLVRLFSASHQRWQTITLWVLMGICGAVNIAYFFISIFQCNPIQRYWLLHDPNWPQQGRCLKTAIALGSTYTVNIVNIVSDFTLALLPISLVWNAKMDKRTKWSVVVILAIGSIASICTIVRVPYVYQLLANPEYLANFIDLAIWSATEIGLALIASSAATLRPLFKKFKMVSSQLQHKRKHSRLKSTFHSRDRSLQLKGMFKDGSSAGPGTPGARSGMRTPGTLNTMATDASLTLLGDDDYFVKDGRIQVERTIRIDIEKGDGNMQHPAYHNWTASKASDQHLNRIDSREHLMGERRENHFHLPTHTRNQSSFAWRMPDVDEVSVEGSVRSPEPVHIVDAVRTSSPRSPHSPPSPYMPPHSPHAQTTPSTPVQPQQQHQGSLLPVPVQHSLEDRRKSSPM